MDKIKVYLAGGMGNLTYEESDKWRKYCAERLMAMADYCTKYLSVEVINPNRYFNFVDKPRYSSQREVKRYDLHHVRTSDLIIVNFNDPNSIGTTWELAVATEHNIPIIGLKTDSEVQLHPWLNDDCDCCERTFTNIDDMLTYIKDFYMR